MTFDSRFATVLLVAANSLQKQPILLVSELSSRVDAAAVVLRPSVWIQKEGAGKVRAVSIFGCC